MTPQERMQLLQKALFTKQGKPTPEALEAIRYLKSMYKYQPKVMVNDYGDGRMRLRNPVIGATVSAGASGPHTEIGFNTDTGLDRPLYKRSQLRTQAITALNAQVLDALPSARNPNPRSDIFSKNFPTNLTITAIGDEKDRALSERRGRPVNQRASAYKRFTGGAFQAYPSKSSWFDSDWYGYTEKIGPTTWQPKNDKGRFMKYVQWDPAKTLKPLITAAGKRVMESGPLPLRIAAGFMEADSLVEGITGVSPSKEIIKRTKESLKDMYRAAPTTNIGPILPF